jgi:hypothetical protein
MWMRMAFLRGKTLAEALVDGKVEFR